MVDDEPPAWLPPALHYLEEWLADRLRRTEQPGCVVAIHAAGTVLFDRAFGVADLRSGIELTPRHRFRVASHSKSFTAASVMLLRERGLLRLDDPVGTIVDGLSPLIADLTVGQLVSHSAGIVRDGADCAHWDDLRRFPAGGELRATLGSGAILEPGERLKYSNVGFGLLGQAIAAVTGEPFEPWIRREIVAASGLDETTPDFPANADFPFASGHTGRFPVGRITIPGTNPTGALASAAGFVSTAADLARFFASLDPAASPALLSAASRREMSRPHWKADGSEPEEFYGLGLLSGTASGRLRVGHTGGFYGMSSCTWSVPSLGITLAVVVNAVDGAASSWAGGIVHVLDRFAREGAARGENEAWVGRWWNPWGAVDLVPMGDVVLVASVDDDSPFEDATAIAVRSATEGTITAAPAFGSFGEGVTRTLDEAGRAVALRIAGEHHLPEEAFAACRRQEAASLDDVETERLFLRLVDAPARAALLAGDAALAGRMVGASLPATVRDYLSALRFDRQRSDEDPRYRPWATRMILLREGGRAVGAVRFHARPDRDGEAELGIRIFEDADRRQGYATEAMAAMIRWATDRSGICRFRLSIRPDNEASLRLADRLGFIATSEQQEDEADGTEHVFRRVALPT